MFHVEKHGSILSSRVLPCTTCSVGRLTDGLVGFRDNTASSLGGMFGPERFGKLWSVLFFKFFRIEGAPVVVAWYRDTLGLGGTVRSSSGLGQILLVVRLPKIPESAVFIVVRRGGNFRRNFSGATEGLFVGFLRGLDQSLLFVIKIVESRSVLCSAVVSLSHSRARVVSFPEPPEDVDKTNLFWVVDDANSFSMARQTTACLLVGRVGGEAGAVSDSGAVDSS